MNQYPQQYGNYGDGYAYYPDQYQAMQWQAILSGIMGVVVLIALSAWAFSIVRKALKGEEVAFPL